MQHQATSPSAEAFSVRGVPVPAYRLQCFGETRVFGLDGSECTPRSRKTRALLVYVLLAEGNAVSRDRLATLLWGDSGEEQARASLRQSLYELRDLSNATPPLLKVTREHVTAGAENLAIDVESAEAIADSGNIAELVSLLPKHPLALFTDLDDVSPDFDDWMRAERTRRAERLIKSAVMVGDAALERGEVGLVRELASTLEMLDPLCEPAVRLGIQADLLSGDSTSAHRRFKRLEERLKREFDTQPSAETQSVLSRPIGVDPPAGASARGNGDAGAAVDNASTAETRDTTLAQPPLVALDSGASATTPALPKRARRSHWRLTLGALLLLAFIAACVFGYLSVRSPHTPSIAILPFKELPPRMPGDYFASGVSEEILNLLARDDSHLRVLGGTSARLFASHADSREVAHSLGVSHLLEGSVRSQGDRVLVSVRLIRASDGMQLWAEEYDRALGDIFAVQQEIGTAVAQRLQTTLAPAPDAHTKTSAPVYDRYLQAIALMRDRSESSITEARTLLLEAVAMDQNYAPAWAALSMATILLSDQPSSYGTIPLDTARSQATQYAQKALSLAPDLGAGHGALGLASSRLTDAIQQYQRAVQLEPQRGEYHRWLGLAYGDLGRSRESLAEYRRAAELEPLWAPAAEQLIYQLQFVGKESEIDRVVQRFRAVSTSQHDIDVVQLAAYQAQGELIEMAELGIRMVRQWPTDTRIADEVASLYASIGDKRSALEILPVDAALKRAVVNRDGGEIEAVARDEPNAFWRDELKDWHAGELLVASGRSALLLQLFDERYGSVDRFWAQENGSAISPSAALIAAFREKGRTQDAANLNARVLKYIDMYIENGASTNIWALERAQQLSLAGNYVGAFKDLDELLDSDWPSLLGPPFVPVTERIAFRKLRADSRLWALQRQLNLRINETRAGLVRASEASANAAATAN